MSPSTAFQMGMTARQYGITADENYFAATDPLHADWLRGWQMADDQDDVELPEEEEA